MSDYTNECYNSGFLLDKDYLPYETKVNDEVLGLIFRTLFKLPSNTINGTDTSSDFSGFKQFAFNKGLIQDATVFGGFNLASSFYDGNKNYSKYSGLDLIGVEFAKEPTNYTASRIINNLKRNNLISVASKATKNWILKNGYTGKVSVGNPICLLYNISAFAEVPTFNKSRSQRLAFVIGPSDVTDSNFTEYNNINDILEANNFTNLAYRSSSIWNTLRTIANGRCIVTNSATIYEAAVICGCFPIYLKTSYNDCEYAIRAFCQDMDIPFNYTFSETMLSDYTAYSSSDNNGTLREPNSWNHNDLDDYRVIGNVYNNISQYIKSFILSLPIEWCSIYMNTVYKEYNATNIYIFFKNKSFTILQAPTGIKIQSRKAIKYIDTLKNNSEQSLPKRSALDRINIIYGTNISNLFEYTTNVSNEFQVYGTNMYLSEAAIESINAVEEFIKRFFVSISIYDPYAHMILPRLGNNSLPQELGFGVFIKNPKSYSLSRLKQNLEAKNFKSLLLESDKKFLASSGILKHDVPVICPFTWVQFTVWIAKLLNVSSLSSNSRKYSIIASKEMYKRFSSYTESITYEDEDTGEELTQAVDVNAICADFPDFISDEVKFRLMSSVISSIFDSRYIFTDSLFVYMFAKYAGKAVYYINKSGNDRNTFEQIYQFAKQEKEPVIAFDPETIAPTEKFSKDMWLYNRGIQYKVDYSNQTYNFLKFIKANYYNSNMDSFIYSVSQENNRSKIAITFEVDDKESRNRWQSQINKWKAYYASDKFKIPAYKVNIAVIDHYEWDPLYKQIYDELSNRQFTPLTPPSRVDISWYVRHSVFENEGTPVNRSIYEHIPTNMSKRDIISQSNVMAYKDALYNGYSNIVNSVELDDSFIITVLVEDIRPWGDDQFEYQIQRSGGGIVYE